jgi:hypothetical protein
MENDMAKTSKKLESLNIDTAVKKIGESTDKRETYADRGKAGRDFAEKESAARNNTIYDTYGRSQDMIERYGKDAPKGRSFMAYEGQSGTVKKKAMGGPMHKMPDGTMMKGKAHGMAAGGKLKMVEKGGKKVPAFAADGVGKMAMGGKCRGMGAATKGGNYKG